jgi:transcriptional regulator with PAS, ATPase and Fis domain
MTDSQLFGDKIKDISSTFGKENVKDGYRKAERKLVTIKSDQTTTEIVIVQFREVDEVWGLVFDLNDIESIVNFEDPENRYKSEAMLNALERARQIAPRDITVLITGETGSGKDYLAEYIHKHSGRSGKYFSINCAAISPQLAESELFGYEKGAFTGAIKQKRGLLELAENGTLLLNEIGDLPLLLQAKLLTFLDTRQFTRVGGEKQISVNARLIAATNQDLEKLVESGAFRKDLFYRLNVISIEVPPLRDRREDIPVLINKFFSESKARMQLPDLQLDLASVQRVMEKGFPGNVRDLKNFVDRRVALAKSSRVRLDIPESASKKEMKNDQTEALLPTRPETDLIWSVAFPPDKPLNELAVEMKKCFVMEALRRTQGNKKEAAELLGITRHYLRRQIDTCGLNEPE